MLVRDDKHFLLPLLWKAGRGGILNLVDIKDGYPTRVH